MTTYYENNKEIILAKQQEKRNAKYEGLIEGYDYIICKECGFKSSELAIHIINKHRMTVDEYKIKYNVLSIKSQKSIDRIKGDKNPAYQHGGKYSPFSKKFINAGVTDRKELVEKVKEKKIRDKTDTTKLDYWLKKTNGNIEEAEKLLSERQSTFSLEKCFEKYGEEKGLEIWLKRQEKWLESLYNKTEEELEAIYKKKSTKFNYEFLWNTEINSNGIFYIIDLGFNKVKIGVTTKTLEKRYSVNISKEVVILVNFKSNINHCFQIEQLLKNKYKKNIISRKDKIKNFGWTETFDKNVIENILEDFHIFSTNEQQTKTLFKETFNL